MKKEQVMCCIQWWLFFSLGRGSRYLNQENCCCNVMGLRAGYAPSAFPDGTTMQEKTEMNVLTVPVWH